MNNQIETLSLAQMLGEQLLSRQWFLVTAESCTGGGIAQAVTEIAGSSQWFEVGLVTYSNRMKSDLLGVPYRLLERQGAVSEAVVRAMCEGALSRYGADIAVAVSGIAGPAGGVPGKPVGTVCFAWGGLNSLQSCTEIFQGNRHAVRQQTVNVALQKLVGFSKSTV